MKPPWREIAERLGRTPAQVLLRWCIQRDAVVIPKSTHRERIAENAQMFDFTLTAEDMAALDALDRTGATPRHASRSGGAEGGLEPLAGSPRGSVQRGLG